MRKRRRVVNHAEMEDLDFSRDLLELGVLLGSHRTALGIKQEDLAKLLGISRITLSRIENSRMPLSIENFFKMALFSGVPERTLRRIEKGQIDVDFCTLVEILTALKEDFAGFYLKVMKNLQVLGED